MSADTMLTGAWHSIMRLATTGCLRRFAVEGEADSFSAGGEYRGDTDDPGEDQLAGDLGLRIGEHLAHRAELGDLATVDDGHAVADLVDDAASHA